MAWPLGLLLHPAIAAAGTPDEARALLEKAALRHYGRRQYAVEACASAVSGGRLQPSQRVRIVADEVARPFHSRFTGGPRPEAVCDGERLWARGERGVTDRPAEGPGLRSWQRVTGMHTGRFALPGRTALGAGWVKQEELKRGARRIRCGVVRIRPEDPAQRNWTEMLWIEPGSGLIWRSVSMESSAATGMGPVPGPGGREGGPRIQPMFTRDLARTRDYDWISAGEPPPAGAFDRPAWADRAK